eukprot:5437875-Amphidinium_carterae.1
MEEASQNSTVAVPIYGHIRKRTINMNVPQMPQVAHLKRKTVLYGHQHSTMHNDNTTSKPTDFLDDCTGVSCQVRLSIANEEIALKSWQICAPALWSPMSLQLPAEYAFLVGTG